MMTRFASALVVSMLGGALSAACLAAAGPELPQVQAGCEAAGQDATPPPPEEADLQPAPAYVVGRDDRLRIRLQPDVNPGQPCSAEYTVGPDGMINFCELGPVNIQGKTEREIEALIAKAFVDGDILLNPTVTAEVIQFRSQAVYVNGAVRTPGQQLLSGNQMTLLTAINQAGWLPESGQDIYVIRPKPSSAGEPLMLDDPRREEQIKYSSKVLKDTFRDPPVRNGDTIWVTSAELFYVNGLVKVPGQKVWTCGMSVGEALAMAGNMMPEASLGRSYIQRKRPDGTFHRVGGLKLETLIQPKDELFINKKLF